MGQRLFTQWWINLESVRRAVNLICRQIDIYARIVYASLPLPVDGTKSLGLTT
jgi:hypothetical protein